MGGGTVIHRQSIKPYIQKNRKKIKPYKQKIKHKTIDREVNDANMRK